MAEAKKQEPVKKKKNNKIAIIVALLAILVIVQGVKIFLDYQAKLDLEQQFEEEQKELATTLQELGDIRIELDDKIKEIAELGGDIEELEVAKADVEKELAASRRYSRTQINRLQGKVDGYQILLVEKDKELEQLRALNEQLYSENTDLKTERNQLNRTISELNKSNVALEDKITIASELRAENVQVMGISSRGRERIPPFKSRQLSQLKVIFNIAENDVAPIEGKDIMIRILDPQNNVIFDVTKGSGTFMLDGKEEFYTAKQEILFDNSQQELTFIYNKGTEYEAGNYNIQIYTPDYLMGAAAFDVR